MLKGKKFDAFTLMAYKATMLIHLFQRHAHSLLVLTSRSDLCVSGNV